MIQSRDDEVITVCFTREADEKECMSLAIRNSKERLASRTESAAERVYWLNRASEQELKELQKEKIRGEIDVAKAKVKNLEHAVNIESLFTDAIDAMTRYSGNHNNDTDIPDINSITDI